MLSREATSFPICLRQVGPYFLTITNFCMTYLSLLFTIEVYIVQLYFKLVKLHLKLFLWCNVQSLHWLLPVSLRSYPKEVS